MDRIKFNLFIMLLLVSTTVVNAQDRMTKRDSMDHFNNRNHTSVGDINRIHYQSGGWQSRPFFESQDVNRSHITVGQLKSLSNSNTVRNREGINYTVKRIRMIK